jgi:hypothetical protein
VLATLHVLLDLLAALPRAESPWPHSVGPSLPFTLAGVGSVLGNVLNAGGSPEKQARMAGVLGLRLFWAGVIGYFALLLIQRLSMG